MKIYQVHTTETANKITLFAKCKIRRVGYDEAHFTFDKKYKKYLQIDASPFAAALFFPSMREGQDLIVEGRMSKALYDGMYKIMEIVTKWDSGFKRINIVASELVPDTADPKKTASFFSGGVDSFYTYLKHKNDKNDPVTHMLLINGFDIDSRNTKLWDETLSNVKRIAKAEHANLIEVESNIRQLIDPILSWGLAHGGCLVAVGLCLRRGLKRIYIPSSYTKEQQAPSSSHLDIDYLWSTEKQTYVHDGAEASRVAKVALQVAKSPTALKYLRVCYKNEKDTYNCGTCDKCLRTMVNLYLAGVLDSTETFPHKIDIAQFAALPMDSRGVDLHIENLEALRERGLMPDLQEALQISIDAAMKRPTSQMKRLAASITYIDHIYTRGKLFKIAQSVFGKKY